MLRIQKAYKPFHDLILSKFSNVVPINPLGFLDPFESLKDIKGIIVGSEPYPWGDRNNKPLAQGHAFVTDSAIKPVIYQVLQESLVDAIKNVHGVGVNVSSNWKEFHKMGILFMNVRWTSTFLKPNEHGGTYTSGAAKYNYTNFSAKTINTILKQYFSVDVPIILMGADAEALEPLLKGNKTIYKTIHPYQTKQGKVFSQDAVDKFVRKLNARKRICDAFVR